MSAPSLRRLVLFLLTVAASWWAPGVLGAPVHGEPVQMEVALTETSSRVGDQTRLRITVTHHHQTRVEFPTLNDKLGDLEVLSARQMPITRHLDGAQVSVMEYTITGFVPGRYSIPPLSVTYIDPQGERGTITASPGLTLEIVSVLGNATDERLRDIKPPVTIPREPAYYAYSGGLLALAAGGLGLLVILYRRWPRGLRPAFLAMSALTPEEEARQELNRIAKLDLLEQEDYSTYYTLISTCLRRYLDSRLRLDALGSTTQELRATMETRGLDRWQARVITGLLEECDSAKWARYQPARARALRALTIGFEIVELVHKSDQRSLKDGAPFGKPLVQEVS